MTCASPSGVSQWLETRFADTMSRSANSFHTRHPSTQKGLRNSKWFQPEVLKHLDDEGFGVALESIQLFVRPDTLSFVLEAALEVRGCTELLLSCEPTNSSDATSLTLPPSSFLSLVSRQICLGFKLGRRGVSLRPRLLFSNCHMS